MAILDPYKNPTSITLRDQSGRIDELLVENEQLKTRLGHAMREHNQVSCEARDLHSQVADLKTTQIHKGIDPVFEHMRRTVLALESENKELKAAQTPRPMSEAPDPGTHAYVVSKGCIPLYRSDAHENWCSGQIIGWLPLPVDQGGMADVQL